MRSILLSAKVNLLSRLPVSAARRYLQRALYGQPLPANEVGDRQLLIDVSVVIRDDARTGIQRVVRALLLQLLSQPPAGYRVRPVFATRKHGYRYAPDHFGLPDAPAAALDGAIAVKVGPADIFLGLDLAAHLLPLHKTELTRWKLSGAQVHVVVYDLLPVLHPQWFKRKTTRNFQRWIKTIAVFADSVICISNAVKTEFQEWLSQKCVLAIGTVPIHTIPLGADLQASAPSHGLPDNIDQLLGALAGKPAVLMVGTLEPRKGHGQVLAAFEKLWERGRDINLFIVGKPGWKTEPLQRCLRSHPQRQKRLYWLDDASDELLELLYTGCTGVIVASQAEGFGLPLVEAMHHHKPTLVRDIPVFREAGGKSVTYFSDGSGESLVHSIESWLANIDMPQAPDSAPPYTWLDSARALLGCLGLGTRTTGEPRRVESGLPTTTSAGTA